jgi:hypothetical protein
MKEKPIRLYPTIACCGIDCGLCPQYHSKGSSRCPGCGGENFYDKHPSCGILTCCTTIHQYQTCAECKEFPCDKFKGWDATDSFVSHKNTIQNLMNIKEKGVSQFCTEQKQRIKILDTLLCEYDDGRSKSKYCLATNLLPLPILEEIIKEAEREIKNDQIPPEDIKEKAKIMKHIIEKLSQRQQIDLNLRKGKK